MNLTLSDEQEMIRDSVHDYFTGAYDFETHLARVAAGRPGAACFWAASPCCFRRKRLRPSGGAPRRPTSWSMARAPRATCAAMPSGWSALTPCCAAS